MIAHNQDAFPHITHRRLLVLGTIDHNGAGGAGQRLGLGEHMDMGVVPVQPGGLVVGEGNVVLEGLVRAWVDHRPEHVVLVAVRGGIGSVIVNVDGGRRRLRVPTVGRIQDPHRHDRRAGGRNRWVRSIVGDGEDEVISGLEVQGRILQPIRRHETKKLAAVAVHPLLVGEFHVQDAVGAEERRGVVDDAACGVTRAGIRHGRYRGKLAGGGCVRLYGHRWAQHPSLIRSYQWSPVGWGAFELTADRTTDLATDLAADLEGLRRVGREWALPGRMAAALRVLCEGNSRSGDEQEYGRCCDSRRKVHMSSHVAEVIWPQRASFKKAPRPELCRVVRGTGEARSPCSWGAT